MKRVLVAVALAGAALLVPATPAVACEGKIDVACNMYNCSPGDPCWIQICLVYMAPRCVV